MTTKESSRHRQSTVTVVRKFKVHWRRLSKVSKCAHLPGHPSGIFPLWGICHRIYPGVGMGIRPFPSCPKLLFQREAKCDDIQFSCQQISFIFTRNVLHLASKGRYFGTRKRPLCHCFLQTQILWVLCMTSLSHRDKYPGGGRGSTLDTEGPLCSGLVWCADKLPYLWLVECSFIFRSRWTV